MEMATTDKQIIFQTESNGSKSIDTFNIDKVVMTKFMPIGCYLYILLDFSYDDLVPAGKSGAGRVKKEMNLELHITRKEDILNFYKTIGADMSVYGTIVEDSFEFYRKKQEEYSKQNEPDRLEEPVKQEESVKQD